MEKKSGQRRILSIRAYARLHLTLLSLTADSYRENGGVGFSISEPVLTIDIFESDKISVRDERAFPLRQLQLDDLTNVLNTICTSDQLNVRPTMVLKGVMPSHSGCGSGTAISLALVEGLYLVNGVSKSKVQLIEASGRGGTSGIGVNTYFTGGLIFDLGRPASGSTFLPSELAKDKVDLPLVLQGLEMPDWPLGIFTPNISRLTLEQERLFFEENCPISFQHCAEATFHSLFGIYAAVKESRYKDFCTAVKAIQSTAWKLAERQMYGDELIRQESFLYAAGSDCVGLSSMGPSLFFFGEDAAAIGKKALDLGAQGEVLICRTRNSGREIFHV